MRSRTISRITPSGEYVAHEDVGDTGVIAEMAKLGVAPALHGGDTYFFKGKGTLAKQFEGAENQLDYIVAQARRKGYEPNVNDVYTPALAQYPGDPAAFVPPSGGINHIAQVCEERDLPCEGAYKRKRTRKEPSNKPFIDKPILKRLARKMVAEDPALGKKSSSEIKEAVLSKHAYTGG